MLGQKKGKKKSGPHLTGQNGEKDFKHSSRLLIQKPVMVCYVPHCKSLIGGIFEDSRQ